MKRLISSILVCTLILSVSTFCCFNVANAMMEVAKTQKMLRLWYNEEAPYGNEGISEAGPNIADDGWEKWSLPLGNGYIGANIFGRTDVERVQITEATIANPLGNGGLNNFSEMYINFGHKFADTTNYVRDLVLNTAVANVSYSYKDIDYSRTYFTNYPDKVMVIKFAASKENAISFTLNPIIPYIKTEGNAQKTGTVTADADEGVITLAGRMGACGLNFEGQFKILHSGGILTKGADNTGNGTLTLLNANDAVIIIAADTNYKLESKVFTQANANKLTDYNPHDDVTAVINAATQKGYDVLLKNHIDDYTEYFGRVVFDLGAEVPDVTTDQLVENYKNGDYNKYLEELYFQYGRYLLIASSREGGMPSSLQGIWNRYDSSPWNSGYWHNINIQMNYWPAFSTNLSEMFTAYRDFFNAAYDASSKNADIYVKNNFPDKYKYDRDNGWLIGTATGPYNIGTIGTTSYTGPGVVGLTAKMFWDYYDYTREEDILRNSTYPTLLQAVKFLTKSVTESDEKYLALYSGSPEQYQDEKIYTTVGSAFDQQMIYETYNDLLKADSVLENNDDVYSELYKQIDKLDPVLVGGTGQVKEFREENMYADIGEVDHRHISQLMGLYPGTQVNDSTPAWIDSSKVTLECRGDNATGWGVAHRLNLWARTKDGNRTYKLYQQLLKENTLTNLWDTHPPFQIDGNFGGTAGVSEMLLQSHDGYITPLAAVPSSWDFGSFSGLVARGNFNVSASWSQNVLDSMEIVSGNGGECKIKYPNISQATVIKIDGSPAKLNVYGNDLIGIETASGDIYKISAFKSVIIIDKPRNFTVSSLPDSNSELFSWDAVNGAVSYNVCKAVENQADYTIIANVKGGTKYTYTLPKDEQNARITWAITAVGSNGRCSAREVCFRNKPIEMIPESVVKTDINGMTQIAVVPTQNALNYSESYNLYSVITKKASFDRKIYTILQTSKYPVFFVNNYDQRTEYAVSVNDAHGSGPKVSITDGEMPDKYGLYKALSKLKAADISMLDGNTKLLVNNTIMNGEVTLENPLAIQNDIQSVLSKINSVAESIGITTNTSFTAKQHINTNNILIKGSVTGELLLPVVSVSIEKDGKLCYVNQFPIDYNGNYMCKFKFNHEGDISDYSLKVNAAASLAAEITVVSSTAVPEVEVIDFSLTGVSGRAKLDSTNRATIKAKIANYYGDLGESGTIVIAYYNDDNVLVGILKKDISLGFNDLEYTTVLSDQNEKATYAKAFIWKSPINMSPMTKALIITK